MHALLLFRIQWIHEFMKKKYNCLEKTKIHEALALVEKKSKLEAYC